MKVKRLMGRHSTHSWATEALKTGLWRILMNFCTTLLVSEYQGAHNRRNLTELVDQEECDARALNPVSKESTPDADREDSEASDELKIEPQPKKQQKQKVGPHTASLRARAEKREKMISQKMENDDTGVAEGSPEFANLIAFDPPGPDTQRFFRLFTLVYKNAYTVSDSHVVGTTASTDLAVFDHPPLSTLAVRPVTGNDNNVVLSDSVPPLPSLLALPVDSEERLGK